MARGLSRQRHPLRTRDRQAALSKLRTVRALRLGESAARHGGFTRDGHCQGPSTAWQKLKAQIAHVAPANAPVLIQGKPVRVKKSSPSFARPEQAAGWPFIGVNCGAINRELLEVNCSDMRKVHSPTSCVPKSAGRRRKGAPFRPFLDELGTCRARCKSASSAFLTVANTDRWAVRAHCAPTCESWEPPIKIYKNSFCKGGFETICSIELTPSRFACHRCASAKRTCRY